MNGRAVMATELAGYLEREIKQRGWSMRHAARMCNIPFSTLQGIIAGNERPPELPTLRAIADGFGVRLGRLIELAGYNLGVLEADPLGHLTEADRSLVQSLQPGEMSDVLAFIRQRRELAERLDQSADD